MNTLHRMGIDLGGTKTEIVVLDQYDKELLRERRPTNTQGGYAQLRDSLCEFINDIKIRINGECTIGIGMPGSSSPADGRIRNANTVCLNGKQFNDDLNTALGQRVRISNDANCFTLAESICGAAQDASTVFGVIIGTGVGGGIVINQRVVEGRLGIAGEWGHNPLILRNDPATWEHARDCYCGRTGCVETWLSGPGFSADYAANGGAPGLPAYEIVKASNAGDATASAALDRYFTRLGRALASVVNLLDPDVIVLGGGMSNIPGIQSAVMQSMQAHIFSDVTDTPVVTAGGGDSAGVLGAAWLWPMAETDDSQTQDTTVT